MEDPRAGEKSRYEEVLEVVTEGIASRFEARGYALVYEGHRLSPVIVGSIYGMLPMLVIHARRVSRILRALPALQMEQVVRETVGDRGAPSGTDLAEIDNAVKRASDVIDAIDGWFDGVDIEEWPDGESLFGMRVRCNDEQRADVPVFPLLMFIHDSMDMARRQSDDPGQIQLNRLTEPETQTEERTEEGMIHDSSIWKAAVAAEQHQSAPS